MFTLASSGDSVMRIVTSVEAQNKFGELLDNAQREPVTITRRGRPVAFLLSPADMKELMDVRLMRKKNVVDFQAFFATSDALLAPAAIELSDSDVVRLVNEVR
jgi:antitoxin Phd